MEKILVIDDEKPTLKMFRLTLMAYGYEVLTAENGQEGLDVFERERPRIVLTDIKMPGMNGIEVLRRIKQIDPTAEVIVITGHGDMDLAIQALNLDAADFINKPIQRHLLEQALKSAQERCRMAAEHVREFEIQQVENAVVITVRGGITAGHEIKFQSCYREALSLDKSRIVLHFLESSAVNGAGIAILIPLFLESRKLGKDIIVAGLSDNLKKVFEFVGLGKLVPVVSSIEEALS